MNNKYNEDELYQIAKKRVKAKKGFQIHLMVYFLVSLLLIFISLSNNAFWFVFPVIGWGIAVIAHFIGLNSSLNSEDEVEKEMRKLKR